MNTFQTHMNQYPAPGIPGHLPVITLTPRMWREKAR